MCLELHYQIGCGKEAPSSQNPYCLWFGFLTKLANARLHQQFFINCRPQHFEVIPIPITRIKYGKFFLLGSNDTRLMAPQWWIAVWQAFIDSRISSFGALQQQKSRCIQVISKIGICKLRFSDTCRNIGKENVPQARSKNGPLKKHVCQREWF